MQSLAFRVAFPVLLTAIALDAQGQDRLYPITELTDKMRAQIDLRDGSVEDWLEVLGEPTLTPLDLDPGPYDPSSFDCRIWLAWHDGGNHLFVAAEILDDINIEWPDRADHLRPLEATVQFYVDGDRSGGTVLEFVEGTINRDITMVQAQQYWAVAENQDNGSNVYLDWVSSYTPWVHQVPYADGGGRVVDSQPVFYVVEFYVTAFDRLIWDAPDQSLVSDLFAGMQIKFAMRLSDPDTEPITADHKFSLFGPDATPGSGADWFSHLWAQGILLGADGRTDGTTAESLSWARIKASLSEE